MTLPDEDLSREVGATPPEGPAGLSEKDFADLMGSISAMAPLLKGFLGRGGEPPREPRGEDHSPHRPPSACHRREALLLALKPYLSPARCAAVDYFIRLARVGDAIRALQ